MSSGVHTLIWYPHKHQCERLTSKRFPPDAFGLHRKHGSDFGTGIAQADIGFELLPEPLRPARNQNLGLFWIPVLPSKCLLGAPASNGTLRLVVRRDHDKTFSRVLEQFETQCALALEEAFYKPSPNQLELAERLQTAFDMALDIVGRFAGELGTPPFWTLRGDS